MVSIVLLPESFEGFLDNSRVCSKVVQGWIGSLQSFPRLAKVFRDFSCFNVFQLSFSGIAGWSVQTPNFLTCLTPVFTLSTNKTHEYSTLWRLHHLELFKIIFMSRICLRSPFRYV